MLGEDQPASVSPLDSDKEDPAMASEGTANLGGEEQQQIKENVFGRG